MRSLPRILVFAFRSVMHESLFKASYIIGLTEYKPEKVETGRIIFFGAELMHCDL